MGGFHSHLAHWNTLYGHWGVAWDLLYRGTLRHGVYVVPLAHHVAYALLVHHVIQAHDPPLRIGVEEGVLLHLVH